MLSATSGSQPGGVSGVAYCQSQADLATERRMPEDFLLFHKDTVCLCSSDHNLAGQERCWSYTRWQEAVNVSHHGLGQQQQELADGHTVELLQNSTDLDSPLLHPVEVGAAADDRDVVQVRGEALLSAGCDGCKDSPSAPSTLQCSEREPRGGAFACPSEDLWHPNATFACAADMHQMKASSSFVCTQPLSSSASCLSDTNLNPVPAAYPLTPPVTCQMDDDLPRSVLKADALLTGSDNEQRGNRVTEDVGTPYWVEAPDSHASSEINNCMFSCISPSRDASLSRQIDEPRDKNTQAQNRVCPPRPWKVKGQREVTSLVRVDARVTLPQRAANCLEDCADGNRRGAAVAETLVLVRSDSSMECSHSQGRDIDFPPSDFHHTEGESYRCKNSFAKLEHWADENNDTRDFASQARFKRYFKDMQHLDGRQAPLLLHEAHRPICKSDTWSSQNVLLRRGHGVNSITFPATVDLRSCDKPVDRREAPPCVTSSSCLVYTQSGFQDQASRSTKGDLRPAWSVSAQRRTKETRSGVVGLNGCPQRDLLEVRKRHLARLKRGTESPLSSIKQSSALRYRAVSLKSPNPKMTPRWRLASADYVQNISDSHVLEDQQEAQTGNQKSVPRMYQVRSRGVQTEEITICPSHHASNVYREEKPDNNKRSWDVREDLGAMYSSLAASSLQPCGNFPLHARWHRDVTSGDTCAACGCRPAVSNATSAKPMASRSRSALRSAAYSSESCRRRYSKPYNQRSSASKCQCARLHRVERRSRGLKRRPGVSLRTTCTVSAKPPFEHPERRRVSHRRREVEHNRKACDFSSGSQRQEEKLSFRGTKTGWSLSNPYYRNGIITRMRNHSNNTSILRATTKVRNEQLDGACKSSTTTHYHHPPSVAHRGCSQDCSATEPDFNNVSCSSRARPCRFSSSLVKPITNASADVAIAAAAAAENDDDDETSSREASIRLANAGYTPGPQKTRRDSTMRECSHAYAHTGASDATDPSVPKRLKASQRASPTNRREYVGPFSGYGNTFPMDMDTRNTVSMSTARTQSSQKGLPPQCPPHTTGDAVAGAADVSKDDVPRQRDSRDTAGCPENSSTSKRRKHRQARLYHKARQLLRQMCHIKGKEEVLFRAAIRLQRKRLEIQELHSAVLVAAKHLQGQSEDEDQRLMSSTLCRRAQKLTCDQMLSHDVRQRRDSRKGRARRSRSTRHHPRHLTHQSTQPDNYTFSERPPTGETTNGQQRNVSWGEPHQHQQQPPQPQQVTIQSARPRRTGGRGRSYTSSASGSTARVCKVGMRTRSSVQKEDNKTISDEDSDDDYDDDESYSSATRSEDNEGEENNRGEKPSTSRKRRSGADNISESSDDDSEDPTKCGFFRKQ